jgi:hypothetical protein
VGCVWKGRECVLQLHIDRGFVLLDAKGREIWAQPYHNLASSNDDGAKLLWVSSFSCPHINA